MAKGPIINDDDIASTIQRECLQKMPDSKFLRSPDGWKSIREAVRRWRVKLHAENDLQVALFEDLDGAKQKGVIA